MSERAKSTWKTVGLVLLVVVPGGSVILLALALYRAWQERRAAPATPRRPRTWRLSFLPQAHHRAA